MGGWRSIRRRELIAAVAGTAVGWPRMMRAQQSRVPLVGYLSSASQATYPKAYPAAFRQGLADHGYIEGKTVAIEYRWADDQYDRLPTLADDLVRRKVDAIATTGGIVSALAAKSATSDIPIVFAMGDDPVAAGVVASFARPGGNLTGVSFFVIELGAKLFELAAELIPNDSPIGVMANARRPSYQAVRNKIEDAAQVKRRQSIMLSAGSDDDFEPAFAELARQRAGALMVTSDPFLLDRRERLVALAAEHAMPAVYAWRAFVAAGGLISYGVDLASEYRRVGAYVGKILSGAKPADLPVEQPDKFQLVVSRKTAKALRLTLPESLLDRADEVIE